MLIYYAIDMHRIVYELLCNNFYILYIIRLKKGLFLPVNNIKINTFASDHLF